MNPFQKRLIESARKAIKKEGLVSPKRINVYEKKKFPKSYEGQYGEANVRQRKGRPVTSSSQVFVRRRPFTRLRPLSDEEMKMGMAHELSHLKYARHSKGQQEYMKKLYKKYFNPKERFSQRFEEH